MAEESEPPTAAVEPTLGRGAQVTSFINERITVVDQLKVALQCLDAALEALNGVMSIDAVTTLKRPCAAIVRIHDTIEVRRGTKSPMGS